MVDRFDRTKDRLENSMNELCAALQLTTLRLMGCKTTKKPSPSQTANEFHLREERSKSRAALLNPTMVKFSKATSFRRSSSLMAHYTVDQIMKDQQKEESPIDRVKPNLRQLLCIDDKFRDVSPRLSKPPPPVEEIEWSHVMDDSDELIAPPMTRGLATPKFRHIHSYRKSPIDISSYE